MQRNTLERCEDAISSLKQELQELKKKYEENQREIAFLSRPNIKKALESFNEQGSSDDNTDMKAIEEKLVHCDQERWFLKEVTGIQLTAYLKKREKKTKEAITYSHILVGRCIFISFVVMFKTLEEQTEKCQVIHINIYTDCEDNSELMKLISRTHKSLNLLGFFRSLSTFAEWCEYRQSTFFQFMDTYPQEVGLTPLSDYMILMNPDLPWCELILVWKIIIRDDGVVIPVLDLLPKMPEQAMALDKTGVMKNAGVNFKTLLHAVGLQEAIENLIQSFCMKRSSD